MTVAADRTAAQQSFAPLVQVVRARRLLDRRPDYYTAMIAINAALIVAVGIGLFAVGNSWWSLGLAVPAAILSARTAFIGHDAAHQQITRSRRTNRLIGLVHGNLLIGMSYGWWAEKHNRHHANPNHVGKDPDVAAGAVVWTAEQAAGRNGVARWIAAHQGYLYLPLLLLEGINLKVSSVRDLSHRDPGSRRLEARLLAAHLVGYLTVVLVALPAPQAVAFIALHQALFGLHLGLAFAPNHKGMPMPAPEDRWSHLHKQVITSRNVRGGVVVDWLLGGLNYQIEHHLFPSMPRPHLRLAQPLVREHCAAVGLPYTETTVTESYRQALQHIHGVGDRLRAEV